MFKKLMAILFSKPFFGRETAGGKPSPLASAFLILAVSISSSDVFLDTGLQFKHYLRVLSFDREWKTRVGDEFVIGLLFQNFSKESKFVKDQMAQSMKESPKEYEGVPIRVVEIPFGNNISRLSEALKKEKVDTLYITPLMNFSPGDIAFLCRELRIATFTGVLDYVRNGISIGLGAKNKQLDILVNLEASRAEGQDFSSRLLSMVTVIEEKAR